MSQQKYYYTIITVHGDLNLTTERHHTQHNNIEDWIRAHQATIDKAFKVADLGVRVIGIYTNHNRSGQKIK